MIVEGIIRESDFVAAQFLNFRPRPVWAVIGIPILAFLAYDAVEKLVFESSYSLTLWFACCIAFFALYLPWKAKRTYSQLKVLSEPLSVEFRDDGVFYQREHSQGLMLWSHFHKWRANKKLMLLYPASNMFIMVPSHFFATPEAFADAIAIARRHLGNSA